MIRVDAELCAPRVCHPALDAQLEPAQPDLRDPQPQAGRLEGKHLIVRPHDPGADQSGQLRTAIDCRSKREAARIDAFVIRPSPRHPLRSSSDHSPALSARESAKRENSATHR